MTQRSLQYGKVLYELNIDEACIMDTKDIFSENPILVETLSNPSIKNEEKYKVIDKLFDGSITNFLKVVTENQVIDDIFEIISAYEEQAIYEKNFVSATLYYVTKPSDAQIESVKQYVQKQYNKDGVVLKLVSQPSLIGGFVLKVYDYELNRSIKGSLEALTQNLVRR